MICVRYSSSRHGRTEHDMYSSRRTIIHPLLLLLGVLPAGYSLPINGTRGQTREFCQSKFFDVTCGPSEVLMITYAHYGRQMIGECMRQEFGYTGCSQSVLSSMAAMCSGRRSCKVHILDESFGGITPCHGDLKSYLNASYTCLKVQTSDHCAKMSPVVNVKDFGYLSSTVTLETTCGSDESPWLLRAGSGRYMTFTLLVFPTNETVPADHLSRCKVYATIKEPTASRPSTVNTCDWTDPSKMVYTSSGHEVEVRILLSENSFQPRFLLKYQAIGCEDPQVNEDIMWVQRQGNSAVIGCNSDRETKWSLTCFNNRWEGEPKNCSTGAIHSPENGFEESTPNLGLSIFLILILAVVVGSIIVAIGLVCTRRIYKRRKPKTHREEATLVQIGELTEMIHDCSHYGCHGDPTTTKPCGAAQVLVSYLRERRGDHNEYSSMRLLRSEDEATARGHLLQTITPCPHCTCHQHYIPEEELCPAHFPVAMDPVLPSDQHNSNPPSPLQNANFQTFRTFSKPTENGVIEDVHKTDQGTDALAVISRQ